MTRGQQTGKIRERKRTSTERALSPVLNFKFSKDKQQERQARLKFGKVTNSAQIEISKSRSVSIQLADLFGSSEGERVCAFCPQLKIAGTYGTDAPISDVRANILVYSRFQRHRSSKCGSHQSEKTLEQFMFNEVRNCIRRHTIF
ncbi:hypothetical protein M513_06995 [Trichuris suis]|uniref:Uncharacterized protein n=1 Tax=Trichuris suis TaxID=68888 RepID=A0A085M4K4_9BILA|nr:hypothetical protein M513_06995 [Trichuris suis]